VVTGVQSTIDISEKTIWEGNLEEKVKSWLSDTNPANSRLALLGDYGSGKSSFCQHLAANLAMDYLDAKEHGNYNHRIPLLIPLRIFAKNPIDELESYLVAYLKKYCKVDNADYHALMKMAESGMLLFILDGFDEMASRATIDTIEQNIELFEILTKLPKNKVLLTTRSEYFMNLKEQKNLQAYPCLYLNPFDYAQIDRYLHIRVPLLEESEGQGKKEFWFYKNKSNWPGLRAI